MPNLPSNDELDAIVEELFSTLSVERTGDDFFFDPENLDGSTRFYYVDFLNWLGIDEGVLEAERICIHADREQPANLDRRRVGDTTEGYSLFIDNGLYRSLDAVYAALAHQFSHMKLIIAEDQSLSEACKCEPIELKKKSKKDKKDEKPADDGDEPDKEAQAASLEVRTEVASFVLGFGKLVLNGACEWDDLDIDDDEGFEHLTTLPIASLAYLHKAVARRADVGSKALEAGLGDEAKEALGKVKSKK